MLPRLVIFSKSLLCHSSKYVYFKAGDLKAVRVVRLRSTPANDLPDQPPHLFNPFVFSLSVELASRKVGFAKVSVLFPKCKCAMSEICEQ